MFGALLAIYLLIGGAHWASHVIQCKGCRKDMTHIVDVFLQFCVSTFGWPISAMNYIKGLFSHEESRISGIDEDGITDAEIRSTDGKHVFRMTPGETLDEFKNRAMKEILEIELKERAEKAREGKSEWPIEK